MTPAGKEESASLADLFEGRRQLCIYHFMFDPSWEAGCPHCSRVGNSIPALEHMHNRSTSQGVVSRAPVVMIMAHKE